MIHYRVQATSATGAEFVSEAVGPGPQFRLVYELKEGTMRGRFQVRMPGVADWHSYLEWSAGGWRRRGRRLPWAQEGCIATGAGHICLGTR